MGCKWYINTGSSQETGSTMLRKAYLDGPFGQLHYLTEGDGPAIVLLHQMVQSSRQFRPAMQYLAQHGLRAIAVDLPGFGMSDGPDDPPSAEQYATIVPALLDHLGLEKAIVCGHHTGASVAVACAHQFPDRVSKLVVHGTPFFTAEERTERVSRPHMPMKIERDGSHFKTLWDKLAEFSGDASSEILNWTVLLTFSAGEKEWFGHNAVYTYDMGPALEALQMPVCVISNRGDMVHPSDKRVAEARPDFAYREMEETFTYHVVYDQPELWAKMVAEFVK
jgi:haloalkane dehalogenase